MTLDDFLRANDMSERRFGLLIEASQSQVHRLRTGESWPSKDLAVKIVEATHGQVTANDFLPPPTKRRA